MKYIRTKDGVYEVVGFDNECIIPSPIIKMDGKLTHCSDYRNCKQANTIEELCDEFVYCYRDDMPMLVNDVEQQVQFVHVHDTIRVPNHMHDTIYLTKVEEHERIVWREREAKTENMKTLDNKNDIATSNEPQCTSVSCDGIDYAMFVSR